MIDGITADSQLRFQYFREVEQVNSPVVDRTFAEVQAVGASSWTKVWRRDSRHPSENAWTSSGDLSLAAWAGQSIQVRFRFHSIDELFNGFTGWMIDDVEVTGGSPCAGATVEVGQVQVRHQWIAVDLEESFTDPVVVAKPASYNGGQPVIVRLRNVTPTSFDLRLQEWSYLDGNYTLETVSYLVVERGRHALAGGGEIEVGTLDTSHARPGDAFVRVNFSEPFATPPLVFSVVGTFNDPQPVATRNRNVYATRFQTVMQEEQAGGGGHGQETLHWIAWTPGSGTVGPTTFEAGSKTNINHSFSTLEFENGFGAPPAFWLICRPSAAEIPPTYATVT